MAKKVGNPIKALCFNIGIKTDYTAWMSSALSTFEIPVFYSIAARQPSPATQQRNREAHTRHRHHSLALLAADQEHDIALRRIDIVVLEEKRLVHAILLQRRELDEQIERARQRLFKHEILLASDLARVSTFCLAPSRIGGALHPRGAAAGRAAPFQLCRPH